MSPHNDKAFLRMFLLVLGALVAFTIIILFTAGSVTDDLDAKLASDSRLQSEVTKRIAPVGQVTIAGMEQPAAGSAPAAAKAAPKSGSQIVTEVCGACHGSGVLGAPKIGDNADWGKRYADLGLDGLVKVAVSGKGSMPPKGGAADLSEDELRSAVEEMLGKSGVDVASASASAPAAPATPEPAATAEPAPAEPAAAPAAEVASTSGGDMAKGKGIYDSVCFVCHAAGVAGAPKLGDTAAWAPRIAQGMDTMYHVALTGKGAMPPKGGHTDLADDDVKAAVDYMVEHSK